MISEKSLYPCQSFTVIIDEDTKKKKKMVDIDQISEFLSENVYAAHNNKAFFLVPLSINRQNKPNKILILEVFNYY